MATANGCKGMHSVPMAPYRMTTNQLPDAAVTEAVAARLIDVDPIGVILAGGKSSRMGQDKACLQLAGESLLQRACNTLQGAGCHRVLLSGKAHPEWHGINISDQAPDAGPVGGIISVLQHIAAHEPLPVTVLFIPVDAPLLTPELLQMLLEQAQNDGCAIEGSPLPVALRTTPAVMSQCASTLPALLAAESRSVKSFLQPLHLARIQQTDTINPCLRNVNTPTEWESLCREFENRP